MTLLLILICCYLTGHIWLVRSLSSSGSTEPDAQPPTTGSPFDDQETRWTALDEVQLRRFMDRSAP